MPAARDKLGTFVNTISNITPITSVENTIGGSKSDLPGTSCGSGATGTVVVAPGIPAIKKWLAESILAGECIDLAELPPAKGRGKNLSGPLEGQVVLLHAADYFQAKRLIPDLASWLVFCPVHGHHRHQTPRKGDFPVNVHGINCKAELKILVAIMGHL